MKLMHVHAKSTIDIKMPDSVLKKLPNGRWGVVTTIQHQHKIGDILKQLESAMLAGQVLGCNASAAEKIKSQVDQWLFVGSGEFHPVQVAMMTGQPVYLWNPVAQEFGQLDKKRVDDWKKLKLGQLNKFLHAKKVGIIVTTKIGQKNLMRALELQKKGDKEYYIFACDELDMGEFENFSFIDYWVNTACPRIPDSAKDMVNIDDLIDAGILKLEKEPMSYEVPIWKSSMGLKK
jgi:2-(3-amino-3-carboxypropyl)histidine synthase